MPGNRVDGFYFATKARLGAGVDQGQAGLAQAFLQVFGIQQQTMIRRTGEGTWLNHGRVQAQGETGGMPGLEATIQNEHAITLAQPGQQPPGTGGVGSGAVVIQHHIGVGTDTPGPQLPGERVRRRQRMTTGHALGHRAAQVALQVGVLRALDMPFGVTAQAIVGVFQGKAAIQDHPPARLLALGQLLGADQLGKRHD